MKIYLSTYQPIDKNGTQIMMPYNQYATNFFDSSTRHKVQ